MADTVYQPHDSRQPERWNRPREEAEGIAAALPPLLVSAERLASGVWLGVHGRRKAGMGETFWQFRRCRVEDPSSVIDWRQSAKSQHLFVREREWEAAETVWFWRDGSIGMRYASNRNVPEKWERAPFPECGAVEQREPEPRRVEQMRIVEELEATLLSHRGP